MVDTQQFQSVLKVDSARWFGYPFQAELQVARYRQVRKQIEDENQQDAEFFYQYLKKVQERFSDRLVCREPKPLGIRRKKKVA